MAFEFIFLGSGTSQGVPLIGKEYPPEFLANPKNHRTRPSIYVATDQTKLVVDTTPEFRIQMFAREYPLAGRRASSPIRTQTTSWVWTIAAAFAICAARALCRFTRASRRWKTLQRVFQYAFTGPWPKGYFIPDPRIIEGPFTIR